LSGKRELIRGAAVVLFLLHVAASKSQPAGQGSAERDDKRNVSRDPAPGLKKDMNEWGVWGGGSFISSDIGARTRDLRLGVLELRYARALHAGKAVAVKATVDAVPAAVMSFPRLERVPAGLPPGSFTVRMTRTTVYGWGLAPVGAQFNLRRRHRVEPFANLSAGFIYFAPPIPDRRGTQLNFTLDLGGGVQVFIRPHRAWSFGYRFQHLSNGNGGLVNPGFDSNIFYAGFSVFR